MVGVNRSPSQAKHRVCVASTVFLEDDSSAFWSQISADVMRLSDGPPPNQPDFLDTFSTRLNADVANHTSQIRSLRGQVRQSNAQVESFQETFLPPPGSVSADMLAMTLPMESSGEGRSSLSPASPAIAPATIDVSSRAGAPSDKLPPALVLPVAEDVKVILAVEAGHSSSTSLFVLHEMATLPTPCHDLLKSLAESPKTHGFATSNHQVDPRAIREVFTPWIEVLQSADGDSQ